MSLHTRMLCTPNLALSKNSVHVIIFSSNHDTCYTATKQAVIITVAIENAFCFVSYSPISQTAFLPPHPPPGPPPRVDLERQCEYVGMKNRLGG